MQLAGYNLQTSFIQYLNKLFNFDLALQIGFSEHLETVYLETMKIINASLKQYKRKLVLKHDVSYLSKKWLLQKEISDDEDNFDIVAKEEKKITNKFYSNPAVQENKLDAETLILV